MEKKVKAFVARDKNGEIYFYSDKPELREDGTFIATSFVSDKKAFKDIEKGEFTECTITYNLPE